MIANVEPISFFSKFIKIRIFYYFSFMQISTHCYKNFLNKSNALEIKLEVNSPMKWIFNVQYDNKDKYGLKELLGDL